MCASRSGRASSPARAAFAVFTVIVAASHTCDRMRILPRFIGRASFHTIFVLHCARSVYIYSVIRPKEQSRDKFSVHLYYLSEISFNRFYRARARSRNPDLVGRRTVRIVSMNFGSRAPIFAIYFYSRGISLRARQDFLSLPLPLFCRSARRNAQDFITWIVKVIPRARIAVIP